MTIPSLSRRGTLAGAACFLGCAHAVRGLAASTPTCADVTAAPPVELSGPEQEVHTILLLLAMALVFDGWGVDRSRPDLLAAYKEAEPGRDFPDYAGHNIGAVLVDSSSSVISCALNRNVQLNSTLAHAEARTIGNAIHNANAAAGPAGPKPWSFGSLLQADRLYTTLEPCAQCAGITDLANIGAIIYGQDDPAQHQIVNVLYNLQRQPGAHSAPLPIRATFMPYWDRLAAADRQFLAETASGALTGLTSFLQKVEAYRIYRDAAQLFASMPARDPGNAAVLQGARAFRDRWQALMPGEGMAPV